MSTTKTPAADADPEYAHTTTADNVTVAEFAAGYEIGDEIAFQAPPDGRVMSAEIVGFSDHRRHMGLPVIVTPTELLEYFHGAPETIAVEEAKHVPRVAGDGDE